MLLILGLCLLLLLLLLGLIFVMGLEHGWGSLDLLVSLEEVEGGESGYHYAAYQPKIHWVLGQHLHYVAHSSKDITIKY